MKGKILDLGTIVGDDNNHYSFIINDIKKIDTINQDKLINSTVYFEVDGKQAINIYMSLSKKTGDKFNTLLNKKNNIANIDISLNKKSENKFNIPSNTKNDAINSNIKKIRYMAIASIVLGLIVNIIHLEIVFAIIPLILYFIVIFSIKKISQSKTIFSNFILTMALMVLTLVLSAILIEMTHNGSKSTIAMFLSLVVIVLCVLLIIFSLKFTRELSYLTGQRIFLWTYYLSILLGLLISIKFLPSWTVELVRIISVIIFIANIYAWATFKEIKQKTEYKNMPWI